MSAAGQRAAGQRSARITGVASRAGGCVEAPCALVQRYNPIRRNASCRVGALIPSARAAPRSDGCSMSASKRFTLRRRSSKFPGQLCARRPATRSSPSSATWRTLGGQLARAWLRRAVDVFAIREPGGIADCIEAHLRSWLAARPTLPVALCVAVRGVLRDVITDVQRAHTPQSPADLVG